ncbi:hypothetical protein SAMN05421878_11447 [Actinobaculum suis]|uniref:Uncharacterized protein n=1 Tax=Actinobaculum suis TaxID=1657 RepID=A0A1G7E2Y4_9ACTO|nr:hypothetical protein SAMN05421878_11447 [Actinobaculum suis]
MGQAQRSTQTVLKALDMAIGLRGRAPRKLVLHAAPDPHGYRQSHWDYPCFVDTGLEGLPVVLIPWEDVSYEWEEKAVYP